MKKLDERFRNICALKFLSSLFSKDTTPILLKEVSLRN